MRHQFLHSLRAQIAGQHIIAVTEDGHVEKAERGLRRIVDTTGEEDCAGAGAKDGVARVGEFADGVVEALFAEKLQLGGGFAAGKDKAVAGFEIVDGADLDRFSGEVGEFFSEQLAPVDEPMDGPLPFDTDPMTETSESMAAGQMRPYVNMLKLFESVTNQPRIGSWSIGCVSDEA